MYQRGFVRSLMLLAESAQLVKILTQYHSNPLNKRNVRKFLGVYIDENLSWRHHIDIISSKINKT